MWCPSESWRLGMVINEDFLIEGIDNIWIWVDKGSYAVFDAIQRLPTCQISHHMYNINDEERQQEYSLSP